MPAQGAVKGIATTSRKPKPTFCDLSWFWHTLASYITTNDAIATVATSTSSLGRTISISTGVRVSGAKALMELESHKRRFGFRRDVGTNPLVSAESSRMQCRAPAWEERHASSSWSMQHLE